MEFTKPRDVVELVERRKCAKCKGSDGKNECIYSSKTDRVAKTKRSVCKENPELFRTYNTKRCRELERNIMLGEVPGKRGTGR